MAMLLPALLITSAAAHSSLLFPPSRNSIDKLLPPWQNGSFGHDQPAAARTSLGARRGDDALVPRRASRREHSFLEARRGDNAHSSTHVEETSIPTTRVRAGAPRYPDGWGCDCVNGTEPCEVGQSCYWFSQGCTIGCEACLDMGANPNTEDLCNSYLAAD